MENALRLHFDAINLFKAESYASALFLSILALEEVGKTNRIHSFVVDCEAEPFGITVDEEKFLNSLYNHPIKQKSFTQDLLFAFPKNFLRKLANRKLEIQKQNSVYVGVHKKNGKPDLKSRLRTPLSIRATTPKEFITIVNDYLILLTCSIMKNRHAWSTSQMKNVLNDQLFKDLKSSWKHKGRLSQTRIKWLERP